MGPTFSFSLDTRGKAMIGPMKKKASPSTQRRNARRREEFLSKKSETLSTVISTVELLLPCFLVTIVITRTLLKRGWGNIKGWSMEKLSWTISYNPLLPPLPRSWESQIVTVMHWLCPQLETQQGSSLATIVMKTCLQTTSVQLTIVADVMKSWAVSRNWWITKELFIQTCVMYASNSLLTRIPFLHIFGKNTWTIENYLILLKWWPICLLGMQEASTALFKFDDFNPVFAYVT